MAINITTDKGLAKAITAARRTKKSNPVVSCGWSLQLRVGARGRSVWRVAYRWNGKQEKKILGLHPVVGLEAARKLAQVVQNDVANGRNPKATPDGLPAVKFDDAVGDYIKYLDKRNFKSRVEYGRVLRRHFSPTLGDCELGDIKPEAIHAIVMDTFENGLKRKPSDGRPRNPGSPTMANRALRTVSAFFSWAKANFKVIDNPARGIKAPADEHERDRTLDRTEIQAVWLGADKLTHGKTRKGVHWRYSPWPAYVKFVMLTGARKNEIAKLRWDEIDLDRGVITLSRERMKGDRVHLIVLGVRAAELLESLPRQEGQVYVFTLDGGKTPCDWGSKKKTELDAHSGVTDWHFHDLRATVATHIGEAGVASAAIEKILSHSPGKLHRTYQQQPLIDQRRDAMNLWAEMVRSMVAGEPEVIKPWR